MNLKDKMMNDFQDVGAVKTVDEIKDDLEAVMKQGARRIFYESYVLSQEVIEEFRNEGFEVEPYEDIHSKEQGLDLVKISW